MVVNLPKVKMMNPYPKDNNINIGVFKQVIGISDFKKPELLCRALTHPSFIHEQSNLNQQQKEQQSIEYRRLAHLGDAILGAIVTDYLYHPPVPPLGSDALTNLKSKLVDKKRLSVFSQELNLRQHGLFGRGTSHGSTGDPNRLLSETFEALVGAIYLELNFSRTRDWLVTRFIKKAASTILDDIFELNQILANLKVNHKLHQQDIKQIEDLLLSKSLRSQVGIDYRPLRELLAAGEWLKADQMTRLLILTIANRQVEGWLDILHIQNLPCLDLQTINQLWVDYSKGRFGFSAQKRIWNQVNNFGEFSDRVGWRINGQWRWYENLSFNERAPEGHLPAFSGLREVPNSRSLWAVHDGEPFAQKLGLCSID